MSNDQFKILLNKLFKDPASDHFIQIFRYLIAGFIAFSVDALLLYLLTDYFHIYYLLSTVFAFALGLLASYIINVVWVFDNRKQKQQSVELVIFITISAVGLVVTFVLMWFLTSVLSIFYLYSKVITTAIVFIWNFIAKKRILF
ncbi:MAG: GtrA family protein [Paludibacter sp.]|nr:GtrA family protein [Paludibacter sp.]